MFLSQRQFSIIIGLMLLSVQSLPVLALTTGSIEGFVLTQEEVYLAQVQIRIQARHLVGGARSTITDEHGYFRILGLDVGKYRLEAIHPDFAEKISTIEIMLDRTTRCNLVLVPLGGSLEIVVTATHPERSGTVPGSVLTSEEIDNLPLPTNRYQDTIALTPEIIQTADGGFHGLGSRNRQLAFFIDGENTTDPVTGTFGFNIPLDAVAALEVAPFGYSAEYGQAQGGMVNLVTGSGADHWTGSFYSFTPVLDYEGVKVMGIQSWNPGFNISGPLFNDLLRVNFACEYRWRQVRVPELPSGENRSQRQGLDLLLGVNFRVKEKHYLKVTALTFPLIMHDRYLAFNRPRDTTVDFIQGGYALSSIITSVISNSTILESRIKFHRISLASRPQGTEPFEIHPDRYAGNYYNNQDRTSYRSGFGSVLSHHFSWLGRHRLKSGFTIARTDYEQYYQNSDILYYNAQGALYRRYTYEGELNFSHSRLNYSYFFQDDWEFNEYVLLNLGLRLDYENIFHNDDWAPRVGILFTPFAHNRTMFRIGWGRFYDEIPLVVAAYEDFPIRYEILYDEETGEITQPALPTVTLLNESLATPYGDQWHIQWEQQWLSSIATTLRYLQKRGHRELQDISIISSEDENLDQKLYLTNANHSLYKALTFESTLQFSRTIQLTFAYTWSSAYGDGSDWSTPEGDSPDPEDRDREWAPLPWDTTHRFQTRLQLPLFWDIVLSTLGEYRTGYPYSVIDENQEIVGTKNSFRFPEYFRLDALISRRLTFTKRFDIIAQGGAINLTDHFNPEYVQNNKDAVDFEEFYGSEGNQFAFTAQVRAPQPRKVDRALPCVRPDHPTYSR